LSHYSALPLHDALPILRLVRLRASPYAFIKVITVHDFTLVGRRKRGSLFTVAKRLPLNMGRRPAHTVQVSGGILEWGRPHSSIPDRKSTRLNSSHVSIS